MADRFHVTIQVQGKIHLVIRAVNEQQAGDLARQAMRNNALNAEELRQMEWGYIGVLTAERERPLPPLMPDLTGQYEPGGEVT